MNSCAQYSLRWNAEGENATDFEDIMSFMRTLGKQWCFQKERSDTGYVHWQGTISLVKKRRKVELVRLCAAEGLVLANYCEPVVNAARGEAFYYTKVDTRIEGPWNDTQVDDDRYVPRQYRDIVLRPWQQKVADSREDFNSRWVDVIVDLNGNAGKSTCVHYCRLKFNAVVVPVCNDADKLRSSVCDILYAKRNRTPGLVFVNLPRAFDQARIGGIMTAIEEIKDGWVYDMRYSFKEWDFDSPRVWVMTNTMPLVTDLSRDRWRFWRIRPDLGHILERITTDSINVVVAE